MKLRFLFLLATVALIPLGRAAVPSVINFQGRISVANVPFTGTGQFKFALVSADGAQTFWANSPDVSPADNQPDAAVTVNVIKGLYSVMLGDTNIDNMAAIPASVFDSTDVRLRIWFNDGPHGFELLTPDQRFGAAGYALRATVAEGVSGVLAAAQLPANVSYKDASQSFSGVNNFNNPTNTFAGSGAGLTQLPATSLIGALTVAPGQPFQVGHADETAFPNGAAFGVAVQDSYAYLANDADGLRIYDISNPTAPQLVGSAFDAGAAEAVVVANTYAYVANFDDGLRIYNVSDPTTPVSAGNIKDGNFTWGVTVVGTNAYVANFDDGLRIYDVSNPTDPQRVGHINSGGNAYTVAVAGQYAYLANDADGLRIYDVSDPANPVAVGHAQVGLPGAQAFGVAVAGHYAYVANGADGLRIYDVSDPAAPSSVGHIDPAVYAFSVSISDNYAFVANDTDGLRIYDITNPASPTSVGHIDDGGAAEHVTTSGNLIYVANGPDGLRIYGYGVVRAGLRVGIGRDPAANALEVEGNASKTVAGAWLANSDSRIKTDIATVHDAVEKLAAVRLVSFKYTDAYRSKHPSIEDRPYLNVVAQEFGKVFPEYVRDSGERLPNGDPILQVDSWPLTIYAAAAVQELNRQNQQQRADFDRQIKERDAQLQSLRDRLNQLETLVNRLTGPTSGSHE